jgi:hypothetical protein
MLILMDRLVALLAIIACLLHAVIGQQATRPQQHRRRRQNHQIRWSSSNSLFHSSPAVLNVRLGDTIDFVCPHYNDTMHHVEYSALYLVSEEDYRLCVADRYEPLFRCDQPYGAKRSVFTLSISKYLPYPTLPEFIDGHSYYFVSTSMGDRIGVEERAGGLCSSKNMRLVVDVQKYYRRYWIVEGEGRRGVSERWRTDESGLGMETSSGGDGRSRWWCMTMVFVTAYLRW